MKAGWLDGVPSETQIPITMSFPNENVLIVLRKLVSSRKLINLVSQTVILGPYTYLSIHAPFSLNL